MARTRFGKAVKKAAGRVKSGVQKKATSYARKKNKNLTKSEKKSFKKSYDKVPTLKSGKKMSLFEERFAKARKAGQKTFKYNGKTYTTKTKNETKAAAAKKPALSSFGAAFKEAKKAGKKTFTYKGKKYTTKTK